MLEGYEVLEELRSIPRASSSFTLSDREAEKLFYSYVEQEKKRELRDYFAGLAMQGVIAAARDQDGPFNFSETGVARVAYVTADAMLKERDKEQ